MTIDGVRHLRFGNFLAPAMLPTYRVIAEAVGDALDVSTEIVTETDYSAWVDGRNDISFICGLAYVAHERAGSLPGVPIAAPVLVGERYRGRPVYFSDVIVSRSNPARSFLDLRGASWAYNEPLSQSGYGVTRHHLLSIGETGGFFGDVVRAGSHASAIEMVRTGMVDATAIDSHVLEHAIDADPTIERDLAVIDTLGPSTIQPITVTTRFSQELRAAIAGALTNLHLRAGIADELARGRIARITEVGQEAYDDIRSMLDACERASFMELH